MYCCVGKKINVIIIIITFVWLTGAVALSRLLRTYVWTGEGSLMFSWSARLTKFHWQMMWEASPTSRTHLNSPGSDALEIVVQTNVRYYATRVEIKIRKLVQSLLVTHAGTNNSFKLL